MWREQDGTMCIVVELSGLFVGKFRGVRVRCRWARHSAWGNRNGSIHHHHYHHHYTHRYATSAPGLATSISFAGSRRIVLRYIVHIRIHNLHPLFHPHPHQSHTLRRHDTKVREQRGSVPPHRRAHDDVSGGPTPTSRKTTQERRPRQHHRQQPTSGRRCAQDCPPEGRLI